MSKKKENKESGDQLVMMDVIPQNAKTIISAARIYKSLQAARLTALAAETAQKLRVLELVKSAKLQPLEGGIIRFEYDNVIISVTPRDELVRIKDKAEEVVAE